MKFFTPQLYVRGQSRDSQVLNEVERLWDEASDRYVAYLDSIRSDLPPGLRRIDDNYYLHDARVCGIGRKARAFVMVLQLDTPPQSLLTLTWDLVEEPRIDPAALPPELCSPPDQAQWLYDEIEQLPGNPPAWAQSILLSNGWEMRLHFRDVLVEEAQALLPVPPSGWESWVNSFASPSA